MARNKKREMLAAGDGEDTAKRGKRKKRRELEDSDTRASTQLGVDMIAQLLSGAPAADTLLPLHLNRSTLCGQ